jgi:hypothetical protein
MEETVEIMNHCYDEQGRMEQRVTAKNTLGNAGHAVLLPVKNRV